MFRYRFVVYGGLLLAVSAIPASAQSRRELAIQPLAQTAAASVAGDPYSGKWTYRSYLNRPEVMVEGDAQKALGLVFGEGVMTLAVTGADVKGTFDMGGGYVLDLSGKIVAGTQPGMLEIAGVGRSGTPTDGWEYDYGGQLAKQWPNGVGQIPAIVGSVIRAKPHGAAKAGLVASFIAVKQP
jgi:hypothetical protein